MQTIERTTRNVEIELKGCRNGQHYLDTIRVAGVEVSPLARRLLLHPQFSQSGSREKRMLLLACPRDFDFTRQERLRDIQDRLIGGGRELHYCAFHETAPQLCLEFLKDLSVVQPGIYVIGSRYPFYLSSDTDFVEGLGYPYVLFQVVVNPDKKVRLDAITFHKFALINPWIELENFVVLEEWQKIV